MKGSAFSVIQAAQRSTASEAFICNSCLQRARPFSRTRHYSTTTSPSSSGYALLPSRRLISISGPDSSHYLQGAITQNVKPSTGTRTAGFFAAFLNATGRVLNDVFIYPDPSAGTKHGDSWLIEVDAAEAERLAKHIKRYKLRAKFDIRLLDPSEKGVWSVWKNDGWTAHTIGSGTGSENVGEISCEDSRAPGMGRRVLVAGDEKPVVDEGVEESTEADYTVRRYLRGVAEGQSEILREVALPQESNIDYMGGIDYRKGCYVGQELTIRTHHTGVVRKRILPMMLYGADENMPKTLEYKPQSDLERPPIETSIGRVDKRGRSAGKFLAGIGNIGLGLCRLEIMTDTLVQGEAGGYKDGEQFKFEWEVEGSPKVVRAKAFLPPWHLTK